MLGDQGGKKWLDWDNGSVEEKKKKKKVAHNWMLNKRNKGVKSDSQVFGMSKHFGVSGGAIY